MDGQRLSEVVEAPRRVGKSGHLAPVVRPARDRA